jgi:REP element-mobilizing transposase RayT
VKSGHPCHVTLRVRKGVPSLRSRAFVSDFRASLRDAAERGEFRVVHYSIQADHLHLIVEAAGKPALGRGMRAVGQRLAHAVHRIFGARGPVLDGRYHLRILRTPREVRNAIAYVLLNARRHWRKRFGVAPPLRLDEASSARWFDGWTSRASVPAREPPDVSRPRTWLLTRGWRRHGLIDPAEVPGERALGTRAPAAAR